MPIKAGYLLLTGAGGIGIWAALKGKSVTGVFRNLIGGQSPANAANANAIQGAPTGTNNNPDVPMTVTNPGPGENAWIQAFLTTIGAPSTAANIRSVSAWIQHEGPFGTQAANNPLNTTKQMTGSTSFDGLAVQNYPTSSLGLIAIAETLESGIYSDVLLALRSGNGLCGQTFQGLATWSGNGYSQVC